MKPEFIAVQAHRRGWLTVAVCRVTSCLEDASGSVCTGHGPAALPNGHFLFQDILWEQERCPCRWEGRKQAGDGAALSLLLSHK